MDLKKLEEAATEQFTKHNLIGWTFGLAKSKRRLGVCKHRTKRIEISEYYATHNSDESVLDTLLHEIAHAIAVPKQATAQFGRKSQFASGQRPAPATTRPTPSCNPATGRRHARHARRLTTPTSDRNH